ATSPSRGGTRGRGAPTPLRPASRVRSRDELAPRGTTWSRVGFTGRRAWARRLPLGPQLGGQRVPQGPVVPPRRLRRPPRAAPRRGQCGGGVPGGLPD